MPYRTFRGHRALQILGVAIVDDVLTEVTSVERQLIFRYVRTVPGYSEGQSVQDYVSCGGPKYRCGAVAGPHVAVFPDLRVPMLSMSVPHESLLDPSRGALRPPLAYNTV